MRIPKWVRGLLRPVVPADRVDDVLGDLEESHRRRVARRGRVVAVLLTSLDTLEMASALLRQRTREVVAGVDGGGARPSLLDFKLGVRMLVRYPGLTLVGGLSMAFAVAIGTAAFEAVRQVVDPTLPFPEGDRIVAIRNFDVATNRVEPQVARDFARWRTGLESVRDVGAYRTVERNLITEGGEGAPLEIAEISAAAFLVTGVAPVVGRVLVEADERPDAPLVLVIGHDVWQSRFGGDPDVVGMSVRVGTSPATIVGVMPSGFAFPMGHRAWVPLRWEAASYDWGEGPAIAVFGRLSPGVTLEVAQAEVAAFGRRSAMEAPETHEQLLPRVGHYAVMNLPIQCEFSWTVCLSAVRAGMYSSNLLFLVFVGLICANVALLMFARAATREGEIIVRSALGANRGRIVAQLFAESLVLGGVAAALGLWGAGFALRTALDLLDQLGSVPFWWEARVSLPTALYAVGLAVFGAAIAGVLPALKVTGGRRVPLGRVAAGGGHLRFGGAWTAIIVSQVALTVFAAATTAYVVQLTARIATIDLGIPAHEYLTVRLDMDGEIPGERVRELERRLSTEPGVMGVAFADRLPGSYHEPVRIEIDGVSELPRLQTASVGPGFFDALDVPVVAGRIFRRGDVEPGQRVAVVNEAFAERVLGGRNAIGRRVRFPTSSEGETDSWGPWHEIVGVVGQVAMGADPEVSPAGVYLPLELGGASSVSMAIHVTQDPASFVPGLRRLAAAIDPSLRLHEPRRLDEIRGAEARWYRMWARILLGSCLLLLALSLAGIYAITSFTVSRRTREIGVRVALGADRLRVALPILARPLRTVALGVGIGTGLLVIAAGGIGSARMAMLVFAFTLVTFGICLLACIVPARRALAVEPTEALRTDG